MAEAFEVSDPAAKWRLDGKTILGLRITAAGLALIGLADEATAAETAIPVMLDEQLDTAPGDTVALQAAAANAGTPMPTQISTPKPAHPVARQTKRDQLIALLSRAEGATLAQLAGTLGWLPHTTRAALTGLRKVGHAVVSDKSEGDRIYRIGGAV